MNKLRKMLYQMVNAISLKKAIIFESTPDYADNTKSIYDEMVRRGFDKRYNLVWQLNGQTDNICIPGNARCIRGWSLKSRLYYSTAKALICCNHDLFKIFPEKKKFNLTHGTPLKDVSNYCTISLDTDFCIAASEFSASMVAKYFNYPIERVIPLGYPRNDVLNGVDMDTYHRIRSLFGKYDKYIVWYPTFRQHTIGKQLCGSKNSLPIIHDADTANKLNKSAQEHNVLIILKPHFAQDIRYIKELNLSNIKFINDSFFEINHISSYEFVASCDALLSDYSSIYFDYLLCDKPIGLVWEDIEEYKIRPGLVSDFEDYCAGGVKLYNIDELIGFLKDVANDVDVLKDKRNELCKKFNYSKDGRNTERVLDFIIDKANL